MSPFRVAPAPDMIVSLAKAGLYQQFVGNALCSPERILGNQVDEDFEDCGHGLEHAPIVPEST
jgi:hypothetical protein